MAAVQYNRHVQYSRCVQYSIQYIVQKGYHTKGVYGTEGVYGIKGVKVQSQVGEGRGGGLKRHLSELSFRHATTKTWAYSRVFGFYRICFGHK